MHVWQSHIRELHIYTDAVLMEGDKASNSSPITLHLCIGLTETEAKLQFNSLKDDDFLSLSQVFGSFTWPTLANINQADFHLMCAFSYRCKHRVSSINQPVVTMWHIHPIGAAGGLTLQRRQL